MDLNKFKKDELIAIINELKSGNVKENVKTDIDDINNTNVIIKSNLLYDHAFVLPDNTEISINSNSTQSISVNSCNSILSKPVNKGLFVNGLICFEDDKWYKAFGLIKPKLVNDNFISNLLSEKDTNNIFSQLNLLTNNKADGTMMNHLSFKISDLLNNNKIPNFNFRILPELNSYFSTQYMPADLSKFISKKEMLSPVEQN